MSSDRNLSRWGDIMLDIEEASKKVVERQNKRMSSKKLLPMPNTPENKVPSRVDSRDRVYENIQVMDDGLKGFQNQCFAQQFSQFAPKN